MAQVTKDFTNDDAGYVQVVHQRGKFVIDGELNLAQRNTRVASYRQEHLNDSDAGYSAPAGNTKYGLVRAAGLEIVAGAGAGEVVLQPATGFTSATLSLRGYTWTLTSALILGGVPDAPVAISRWMMFVELSEAEVGPAGDPTMLVEPIGETAVRTKLIVNYRLVEWAFGADPPAGISNTASEPHSQGSKAGLVALVIRQIAAAGPVTLDEIQPWFNPTREFQDLQSAGSIHTQFVSTNTDLPAYVYLSDLNELVFENTSVIANMGNTVGVGGPVMFVDLGVASTSPTMTAGSCVVLEVPHQPLTPGHTQTELEATYDVNAPDAINVVALKVIPMSDFGEGRMSLGSLFTDQNSTRWVIALKLTDGPDHSVLLSDGSIATAIPVPPSQPREGQTLLAPGPTALQAEFLSKPASGTEAATVPYFRDKQPAVDTGFRLIQEFQVHADFFQRVYTEHNVTNGVSGFMETLNARWTGTQWVADTAISASSGMRRGLFCAGGVGTSGREAFFHRSPGEISPWDHSTWDPNYPSPLWIRDVLGFFVDNSTSKQFNLNNIGTLSLRSSANPVSWTTNPGEGKLYDVTTVKHWSKITIVAPLATIVGGFNVKSVVMDATGIDIEFVQAVQAAHYFTEVDITVDTVGTYYQPEIILETPAGVRVQLLDASGGTWAILNPTILVFTLRVKVTGKGTLV